MSVPVRVSKRDTIIAFVILWVVTIASPLVYAHETSAKFDRFCRTAIQTNISLNALIANNIHRITTSTVLTPQQKADQLEAIHRVPRFGPVDC